MSGISFRFSAEIKILSPLYWMPSTVLMLSPTILKLSVTVLNSLHSAEGIPDSTEAIPHMYCSYPPHSTEGIPPQCWCYLPTVLILSPTCTNVIPTALNNLHSTEAIPHSTEAITHSTDVTPMYWTTSTWALNQRYMGWVSLNSPLAFSQLASISLLAQLNAHSPWSHL